MLHSDIKLKLSIDHEFVTADLGSRVEIACVLDCNCLDLDITPVWVRDTEDDSNQTSVRICFIAKIFT